MRKYCFYYYVRYTMTILDNASIHPNLNDLNLYRKAAPEIVLPSKVHCTTPLTPQGHHYIQSGDNHHLYHFASPRIDLNPRLFSTFCLVSMNQNCFNKFSLLLSPSTNLTNVENKSSVGVLRFFHRKKIIGGK